MSFESTDVRTHNKSGTNTLQILRLESSVIRGYRSAFSAVPKTTFNSPGDLSRGFLMALTGSPCIHIKPTDGRITYAQKKLYAFHLVALDKFGPKGLEGVTASKLNTDLTITHACGSENCVNADHIRIETKAVNDSQTICHTALRNSVSVFLESSRGDYQGAHDNMIHVRDLICVHEPRCLETDGIFNWQKVRDEN